MITRASEPPINALLSDWFTLRSKSGDISRLRDLATRIDAKSIGQGRGHVNTKSIDSSNQGCTSTAGLVAGEIGRHIRRFYTNREAIGGSRRHVRWSPGNRRETQNRTRKWRDRVP